MELFEIHITGKEEKILEVLTKLELKSITIELLAPQGQIIRREYMSSIQKSFFNYKRCIEWVNDLVIELIKNRCSIQRVKIESPYRINYAKKAIYIESHFYPFNQQFPISRNFSSQKLLATDREYDKNNFYKFKEKYKKQKAEVELCLFDTFINEDKDWFDLYKQKKFYGR